MAQRKRHADPRFPAGIVQADIDDQLAEDCEVCGEELDEDSYLAERCMFCGWYFDSPGPDADAMYDDYVDRKLN